MGLVRAINVMELLAQHPSILLKGIKWSLDLSAFSHIYSAFGHIVVEGLKNNNKVNHTPTTSL